jgi:DNA-binding NarL/FixJ family response regulator
MNAHIFILESDVSSRRRITELIAASDNFELCGTADDEADAVRAIALLAPSVVVVDTLRRQQSPYELVRTLHQFDNRARILVMSELDESVCALPMARAGARGFIAKHDSDESILSAVRRVDLGLLHFSAGVEREVRACIAAGDVQRDWAVNSLTARELEIGMLLGQRATSAEIAARLSIAESTVETHERHLKNKLRIASVAKLRQFWLERRTAPAEQGCSLPARSAGRDASRPRKPEDVNRRPRRRGDPSCNAWAVVPPREKFATV